MLAATAATAQVVDDTLSDLDRDVAAIVLKNTFSLLDKDDKAQVVALQRISRHEPADGSANSGVLWLSDIIKSLQKDRKVGWAAVFEWARHADAIGRYQHLLENLAFLYGGRMDHPNRDEPGWLEALDEARAMVAQSCDDAILKAKQSDSSVAEAALDCAGFNEELMSIIRSTDGIAGIASSKGHPNGNEL